MLLLSKQRCSETPPVQNHESRWLPASQRIRADSESAKIKNYSSSMALWVLQESYCEETFSTALEGITSSFSVINT